MAREIKKYRSLIEQKLFPGLKDSMNMSINSTPTSVSTTLATYIGSLDSKDITFEFSSNHIDLADYENQNVVFLYLYYNRRGTKAGVINLDDINEAVDLIYASLYELGYRSPEDKEQEKAAAEAKAREEQEKIAKRKEELKQELSNQEDEEEIESDDNYEQEVKESIQSVLSDFDKYIEKLDYEGILSVVINIPKDSGSFKVVDISCTYISNTTCYVETNGINPQIQKSTSWEKAKSYCAKVLEKLNAHAGIYATDANGNVIELEPEGEDSDDVNLDFDI